MFNEDFTQVQKRIYLAVVTNDGLPITGLYQLALDLDIDYRWARRCVWKMERMGLLVVDRPYGREMLITARTIKGYWSFRPPMGGSVLANLSSTMHKAQTGGTQMDPIASLRASYKDDNEYPRPELSPEEADRYSKAAARLNSLTDQRIRLSYIIGLVIENARLLKETNEHRAARGYEPLPVYDPGKKGK